MEYFETKDGEKLPRLPLGGPYARMLGNYGIPNAEFLEELTETLKGKSVLEVFAGNGRLAGELSARGIAVTSTSTFSSHDLHSAGLYFPVKEMDAVSAVAEFGADHDVLLFCWPTATHAVLQAAALWGEGKDIVFIGEVTDYTQKLLGGCATDEFFEHVTVARTFTSLIPQNMVESAFIGRFRRERRLLPGKDYSQ